MICILKALHYISMASSFKKTELGLELLIDIDMLLMTEKGIRGGICHSINRYGKANNKDNDKNKELPYLKYWNINNLYGWAMSRTFTKRLYKKL